MAKKTATKSTKKATTTGAAKRTSKKVSTRRELIDTGTDKRYVRRSTGGQFKESDDVGRSLATDRRTKAKTAVKSGQGDRGDRAKS